MIIIDNNGPNNFNKKIRLRGHAPRSFIDHVAMAYFPTCNIDNDVILSKNGVYKHGALYAGIVDGIGLIDVQQYFWTTNEH